MFRGLTFFGTQCINHITGYDPGHNGQTAVKRVPVSTICLASITSTSSQCRLFLQMSWHSMVCQSMCWSQARTLQKMAEPTDMLFGVLTRMHPRNHALEGGEIPYGKRTFEGCLAHWNALWSIRCWALGKRVSPAKTTNRSSTVTGPHIWNSLPAHLRDEDITHNSFRRELKVLWF